MKRHVIVVERPAEFRWRHPACLVVAVDVFITQPSSKLADCDQVINLCSDYRYLGLGYYASLLAEARGQKVIPSVDGMLELGWKRLYSKALPDLNALLAPTMRRRPPHVARLAFRLYFGEAVDRRFARLGLQIFDHFRSPIIEVTIRRDSDWEIESIRALPIRALRGRSRARFEDSLAHYIRRRWRGQRARPVVKYRLAVLHDPDNPLPPSNPLALRRLARVGREFGIRVELIRRHDYNRISEYDALFIRETTALDHYTYRFARRAVFENIPVIDDPDSILRCTNKVFLAEIFRQHRIPAPRTVIIDRSRVRTIERELNYPIILKIPDGSFSRGVFKADDRRAMESIAQGILKESDVLLAQEFMPTRFDWRVAVLNHEPLFVCRYIMPPKHWQILKHESGGRVREGRVEAVPIQSVPGPVVAYAVRACRPIGDGFYGVDVKETERGIFVIEVNENPNLWAKVEDAIVKDEVYRRLLGEFVRRIEGR